MVTKRVTSEPKAEIKERNPEIDGTEKAEKSETSPAPVKLADDARVQMLDNGNVLCHFSFGDLEVKELSARGLMHLETWMNSLPSVPGTVELLCKLTHSCLVNAPQFSDYEVFAESIAREDFDVLALVSYQFRILNNSTKKPVF